MSVSIFNTKYNSFTENRGQIWERGRVLKFQQILYWMAKESSYADITLTLIFTWVHVLNIKDV